MRSIHFGTKTIPAAFALVTLLAYGWLIPLTGFYWDDWPFAWIARFLGPAEFIPAFQGFRPFLGPVFYITTSLIPSNPLLWQLLALLVRFAAALAAWFALHQVWPSHRQQALAVALLFLVYPGYSQHWVAFTHINQEWIPFIAYLVSFGLSVRAFRRPKAFLALTSGALMLEAAGVFPTEYFIGLEPLRLLLFWVIAAQATQSFAARTIKALKAWSPYFAVWLADVIWLVHYYGSGAYVSYDPTATTVPPSFTAAVGIFGDALWKACLYVWGQVLFLLSASIRAPASLLTIALIAAAFLLASFYLSRLELSATWDNETRASPPTRATDEARGPDPRQFAWAAVIIGIAGIVLGRLPSFVAGLPLTLQSSFDRFMISMMLGGSLFAVGMVELILRRRSARIFTIAGLLALGIGQQFFNSNIFRRDWQRQTEIYWQFAWRIPALQPGTAVITTQMPLDYETDLSMTAALNWMYASNLQPPQLPYAMVYAEKRLGGIVLPDLAANTPMQLPFRTMSFLGSTSQTVVVYVPSSGCLRVLDPANGDEITYSRYPESLTTLIPLSKPGLILTGAQTLVLPAPPFGPEPRSTWCYYYERAELALQAGDWNGVVTLGAEAAQRGALPEDAFEWLPFIEAEARAGSPSAAEKMTREALNQEPKLDRGLCGLWSRMQVGGPLQAHEVASRLLADLKCSP